MEYITIKAQATARLEIKKSKFIGDIAPVQSEAEAAAFLTSIKARYPDASHHVYAWNLRHQNLQRFSDAGEPSGTAGKPVLDALAGAELLDVALVVTRYFGGTLLGTGGLTHAYSQTAAAAVAAAVRLRFVWCCEFSLSCPYTLYPKMQHMLPQWGATVLHSHFGEDVVLGLLLQEEDVPVFQKGLTELSSGTLCPAEVGWRFGEKLL